MHNSSKTIGNSQDAWEMGRKKKTITHAHFGPKKTQEVAPTAQTSEEATLLMLI
jgi:hypothetical protein